MTHRIIIDTWTKFSQSVDGRDKSLKILYYGSKMLYNYLDIPNGGLTDRGKETLNLVMNTSSIARKAFRLLKSLTHISNALKIASSRERSLSEGDIESIVDFLQQCMWASCIFEY